MAPQKLRAAAVFLGGWAVELLTVGLSVVDVVSDLLVARQFHQDGHRLWFWLVMASLIVSNVIYAAALAIHIVKWMGGTGYAGPEAFRRRCVAGAVVFVAVFPVAQLFPLVQWGYDTCIAAGPAPSVPPDRKSTRLNSSHLRQSRMPSSA